ncbi:TIR domain-containing protein [Erythrobacter oryzae]|uniref:TIR domain-containing protein n=1 Tax=Erythrobacter oryzae TaxID=3019556 RepID=UPI0025541FED|nr:TIR domain-containing protein [Erythrobacter sp. COR-2]
MVYRNGTYIAFHAEGKTDPTASDIRYYRMLKAWHENDEIEFKFVNSHEKVAAVRDTSRAETVKRSLRARLDSSKNMVLIVGSTTKNDRDFVPYEISYAVDNCKIPIIATYPGEGVIRNPKALSQLWPAALKERIENGTASVIHIPFNRKALDAAMAQFGPNNLPNGGGLGYYDDNAYRQFGLL